MPEVARDDRWLAVASAGGHLNQLLTLTKRISGDAAVWVSYPVEPALSAIDGHVIWAHHPTTKHLPNAARNYRLARKVLSDHRIDRVISTGAAVAVPFMAEARRQGIPCHYIESATRVDGPSLSGRMLQPLRGVRLYRQLGTWGGPRWRQGPCVFDGFATTPEEAPTIGKVVVSLGTHGFPFSALVDRLATCFRGSDTEVLWQLGSTPDPGSLPGRVRDFVPPGELEAEIVAADVVVGHAGVGFTLTSLRAGTRPVVVPRMKRRREHTDDHQVKFARELHSMGLAVGTEVENLTMQHLEQASSRAITYQQPPAFTLAD